MCLFGGLQSAVKSIKDVSKGRDWVWRDRCEEMELIPGGDFEWWFRTSVKTNFEYLQERVWDRASPTLRTAISDVQFHMTECAFFEDKRIKWRTDGYFSKMEKREETAAWRTTTWRRRFQKLKREEEDGNFEYSAVKKK